MGSGMKSVKELRKRAAARVSKKTTQIYSTSEARANFAEALETAQVESAVVGFDRYGRTVAALVPVEAIYMLAGQERLVPPAVREAVIEGAKTFIAEVPNRLSARAEAAAKAPRPKAAKPKPPVRKKRAKAASAKNKRTGR